MGDLTLVYAALIFLIIQGAAVLVLTAGLYILYKKKNGAGEKSPEWWSTEIDRIVEEHAGRVIDAIKRVVQQ